MKTTIIALSAITILAATGFESYRVGHANGFHVGESSGYVQGLEDSTSGANTSKDPGEVCIDGQCEAVQN